MKPTRILVVDDEANIRATVQACLQTGGYAVEQAANGVEAMEAILRNPPDLVLLDLAMPVMDGMTVLSELWAKRPELKVRVVVMTAHGSVRNAVQAMRLGASDFLEKPFLPEDLRLSVASVLREPAVVDSRLDYGGLLHYVRQALHDGRFVEAEAMLVKAGMVTDSDAAFLNLVGVLHEAHGRKAKAREFYQKALDVDAHYKPAKQNLRRSIEIQMGSQSPASVSLGDGLTLPDALIRQEPRVELAKVAQTKENHG
jgi:CheY-like chemotaxis protein